VVKFQLVGQENVSVLCEIKNPWTLVANVSLCVSPSFKFVKFQNIETQEILISSENYFKSSMKSNNNFNMLEYIEVSTLKKFHYVPIFPYLKDVRSHMKLTIISIV
jgi:isoleucyl-tRNA synthetase